jgi:hypothetical protein
MTVERSDHAASVTDGLKIVGYGKNNQGRIEKIQGEIWQPVNEVNLQAWLEIERLIESARNKVTSGRASCLYYYMTANQMTVLLLARYTRQAAWRVLLHLHPFFFKRLKDRQLDRYATLFQVSVETLRNGELQEMLSHIPHRHD